MALTNQDIHRIAHLARIQITQTEAEATRNKLTGILELIAQMQSVNTVGVAPMSHSQDLVQRLREDVVTRANQRDAFQAIAPQTADGLYLVPKVIE